MRAVASFAVLRDRTPEGSRRAGSSSAHREDQEPPGYTIGNFGSGTAVAFSVVGQAPLGPIAGFQGSWRAPLREDGENSDVDAHRHTS